MEKYIAVTSVNSSNKPESFVFCSSCKTFSDFSCPKSTSKATSVSFGGSRYLSVSAGELISIFNLKKRGRVKLLTLPTVNSATRQQNSCTKAVISGYVVAAASKLDRLLYIFQLKDQVPSPARLAPIG